MSDDGVDELFAGPLETFVKRRDALSAERKKGGDKTGAAAVKAIVKPTVSAHGVNRLWTLARAEFDALLAAGEALRNAVRQGGGDALRDAQKRQRDLVTAMRDRATELLVAEGHAANSATLERVARTLGAISSRGSFSPGAPGHLSTDLDPPGLDELMDIVAQPATTPSEPTDATDAPAKTEEEKRRDAEEKARVAELAALTESARVADADRDRARASLDKALAARDTAERTAKDLLSRIEAAQIALAEARQLAEHATHVFEEKAARSAEANARLR